jgi:hypothetical protein
MDLLSFAEWCATTRLAIAITESPWAFAVTESIHLLALAVIGGTVLLVDMRLLGLGLIKHRVQDLARDVWPWQNGALVTLLVTGVLLFLSEAKKCYYSTPFWIKIIALLVAMAFLYTIKRRAIFAKTPPQPLTGALIAVTSLVLWFTVGASGRWIGFSG